MERCSSDLRNWMYQDILNINDDKIDFFFYYWVQIIVIEN